MTYNWLCSQTSTVFLVLLILMIVIQLSLCQQWNKKSKTYNTQNSIRNDLSEPQIQRISKEQLDREKFIDSKFNLPHSRKKRLIWIADDGRLALPPGTALGITTTLSLPLVRHPPEGFLTNFTMSFPLTIDFDKLGLTDNQNPLGDLSPLFSRSFGRYAGHMLGNYMNHYLHYKRKREVVNNDLYSYNEKQFKKGRYDDKEKLLELPQLPERFKHFFHGGERILLYSVFENLITTFGMDGKACLLRTICEVHARSLEHFGVFGEMIKLLLAVKRSPFADLVPEYVNAQDIGEGSAPPGECFPYYKNCPRSIFKPLENNKYSDGPHEELHDKETKGFLNDESMLNEMHYSRRENRFSM